MCYLFWFDSGNGPSHHLLERCCYTQHFGLCSRTVDHSARMGEYWSQGVERAVSFHLDYGQLAQHSMRSRFSTVFQRFVGVLTEGHQKRRSVRKTSLYAWLLHGPPLILPLLGISFKRSTDRLREGKNTVEICTVSVLPKNFTMLVIFIFGYPTRAARIIWDPAPLGSLSEDDSSGNDDASKQ